MVYTPLASLPADGWVTDMAIGAQNSVSPSLWSGFAAGKTAAEYAKNMGRGLMSQYRHRGGIRYVVYVQLVIGVGSVLRIGVSKWFEMLLVLAAGSHQGDR